MRCVLGRCYAFVILKHHQQLKFGCSLELCRVSVTFNNTSYTDSQNRITATQLHPQHHNKERDYTGCTTKPYLFDTSTSTQQTAQAFLPWQPKQNNCHATSPATSQQEARLYRVYHETLSVRYFYIDTTNCAGISHCLPISSTIFI